MLDLRLIRQTALFGISLLGVQGTIYLFQFGAAAQMSPTDYSKVRIIESLVAIGALIATFGMPSVALVRVGLAPTDRDRRRLVATLVAVVACFGIIAAIGFLVANRFGFLRAEIEGYAPAVVAISGLMAFRLLLTAVTQSRQHFARLATLSAAGCVAAVACYGILAIVGTDEVVAWLFARTLLELVICAGLAIAEFWPIAADSGPAAEEIPATEAKASEAPGRLAKLLTVAALPIGASLVARSLVDNGPVLWLAAIGTPAAVVAQVGILLTMVTVSLVPGGVIQGVAVPRLTLSLNSGRSSEGYGVLFGGIAVLTAIAFVALVIASTYFLSWGNLTQTGVVLAGVTIVAAKMAASAMGGYLLVVDRGRTIFLLNCLTLAIAVTAASVLQWQEVSLGLMLVVGVLALIEAVATICYGIAVSMIPRSPDVRPNRGRD